MVTPVYFRYIAFCKWRRRWCIRVYLREPVSEVDRSMLNRVLKSFQFDAFPTGDEIWAASLAREHLWPESDPNLFPLRGSQGHNSVRTEKEGDEVVVMFTRKNPKTEKPEKVWRFRVTATGKVIPISRKKHTTRKQSSTMQTNDPRRGARVELVLDKQEYFLGENILLHYGVSNQGMELFRVNAGGDYRGAPRHLRFKVVATDAEGKLVEDPYPSIMYRGGLSSGKTLQPGETWWQSLPLMRLDILGFNKMGLLKISSRAREN